MTQTLEERVESALEAAQRRSLKEWRGIMPGGIDGVWFADVPNAHAVAKLLESKKTEAGISELEIAVPGTDFAQHKPKPWMLGRSIRLAADGTVECYQACLDLKESHLTSDDL